MAEMIYNPAGSREMSKQENRSPYQFDRNIHRTPENMVTIFTVNKRKQFSSSAGVAFSGRAQDERYLKVGTITDPKYYVDDLSIEGPNGAAANKKQVTADDGRWVAMDWLNPQNTYSLDQNFVVPDAYENGTNLLARGLFFIVRPYDRGNMNDAPTEEEIAAAETRLRGRYTALVRAFQSMQASNPTRLPDLVNEEMLDALNFAGLKTPYNTLLKATVECPTCGDSIPAGVKFHKSESLGVICINPSVDGWKAAVAAGIKSRDDVPEEFRWAGRNPR